MKDHRLKKLNKKTLGILSDTQMIKLKAGDDTCSCPGNAKETSNSPDLSIPIHRCHESNQVV